MMAQTHCPKGCGFESQRTRLADVPTVAPGPRRTLTASATPVLAWDWAWPG